MSTLLTDEVAEQVRQQFQGLEGAVQLVYFTEPMACAACTEQRELVERLAELSDKLSLDVQQLDSEAAITYGVDKAPATVVRGQTDYGIRFYGVTSGYEFSSLIEAIHLVSHGPGAVDPEVAALAGAIRVPTHLEVMVTLSCPYCPRMVALAHELAVANELVRADMVDAAEFPQLINRYDVQGVPLTVVNGRRGFEGALAPDEALLGILKIADPDAYETLDIQLRESRGQRRASTAATDATYDVIVVGAGPAGLAAAIYAQRKGRATALIGKQAGGQLNDTATVENYPGLVQVGGADLAQLMREHAEAYPVAERCHTQVNRIDHDGKLFRVQTDDGQIYVGRTLIYCTGKRYRRLEVPGEERFIGRGVAWCATCDAPLFKDKRVAVVGGGNSAFTAVRDLLRYATEIHLIHNSDKFSADPVLVEEARQAETDGMLRMHLDSQVREYLGGDRLEGIRLAGPDGKPRDDLAVEGVFLEIGLEPNSAPLAQLVELNQRGEIPVDREQATVLPGLFAAGDVTDEREKQIVVAAGAGAKAALAADRYLAMLDRPHPDKG